MGRQVFFIGTTYSYTAIKWLVFGNLGYERITNWIGNTPSVNEFFYQMGLGGYITSSRKAITSWLVELDGTYASQTRARSKKSPNSGGTLIYITPSFAYARETIVLQFGTGFPVVQNYIGDQPKQYISLNFNFSYTFN